MYLESETLTDTVAPATTPSADFVRAISDFLDTDPADLLVELGYYNRSAPLPAPQPVEETPPASPMDPTAVG